MNDKTSHDSNQSESDEPQNDNTSPAKPTTDFRDVTSQDVSVDDHGNKLVSPDYLVQKNNKHAFSIVGIFVLIIVIMFVFLFISMMIGQK